MTAVWLRSPIVAEFSPESDSIQLEILCNISLVEYVRFPPSLFRVSRLTLSLGAVRGVVRRETHLYIYATSLPVLIAPPQS